VRRAAQSSCTTSAQGGDPIAWLGAPPSDPKSPAGGLVAALSPAGGKDRASVDQGDSAAAGDSLPSSPPPGPEPGGSASGSATGASGAAAPSLLALAGLLLIVAPRALRRLRLISEPLLTLCFVLIPEHPD
jgi:hypothetical protein